MLSKNNEVGLLSAILEHLPLWLNFQIQRRFVEFKLTLFIIHHLSLLKTVLIDCWTSGMRKFMLLASFRFIHILLYVDKIIIVFFNVQTNT